VLNVAPLAAFQPVPLLATYAASKVYVLSLTESPPEELKCSGVTVTALCSCITATPDVAGGDSGQSAIGPVTRFVDWQRG
jgi:short-subunit dehydrogenase